MAKQTKLEIDGKVVEVLPAGKFRVKLMEMDTVISCYKSWKMKLSHISVIEWDKVKVEVSPYDVSQWRITYRYNLSKPSGSQGVSVARPKQWWFTPRSATPTKKPASA